MTMIHHGTRAAMGLMVLAVWGCSDEDLVTTPFCRIVMCDVDSDCDTKYWKGGCDVPKQRCRQCTKDADCDTSVYRGGCMTERGTCAQCRTDAHCFASRGQVQTGKCDTTLNVCIRCTADADCLFPGSLYKHCGPKSICVNCLEDKDCTNSQFCVDGDCMATKGGCTKDSDCKSPLTCKDGLCSCSSGQDCLTAYGLTAGVIKRWDCK